MKIEHYVEYLYPGSLFPEESSHRIEGHWDLRDALEGLKPGAFAFTFYDLQIRDGRLEDGQKVMDAKRINISCAFYPDATVDGHCETRIFTLPEIQAMGRDYRILAGNMESNDYSRVVRTRRGNWQPFSQGDNLVQVSTGLLSTDNFETTASTRTSSPDPAAQPPFKPKGEPA